MKIQGALVLGYISHCIVAGTHYMKPRLQIVHPWVFKNGRQIKLGDYRWITISMIRETVKEKVIVRDLNFWHFCNECLSTEFFSIDRSYRILICNIPRRKTSNTEWYSILISPRELVCFKGQPTDIWTKAKRLLCTSVSFMRKGMYNVCSKVFWRFNWMQ